MTRLAFDAVLASSAATQEQNTDRGADADCLADDEQIVPIAASAPTNTATISLVYLHTNSVDHSTLKKRWLGTKSE